MKEATSKEPSIWWSSRFKLGWILIIIAAISSLFWTGVRWSYENSMRGVQLTVDHDDTRTLADAYQIPHADLLKELNKRGISSVGLYNQSLGNFRDNNRLAITPREEAERLFPAADWRSIPVFYRYLVTFTPENEPLIEQILPRLREQLPANRPPLQVALPGSAFNAQSASRAILLPASRTIISDSPLGFDPQQVKLVKDAGMTVTARMGNTLNLNRARMIKMLDDAKGVGARVLIFSDDEVLGYDTLFKDAAKEMKARNLVFGNIEFSKQRGWQDFSKLTDGLLVRVHSVGADEAAKAKTELLVDRFARAAKERDIRVAYIRMLRQYKGEFTGNPKTDKTALQQNLKFISDVADNLRLQQVPAWIRPALETKSASEFGNYPANVVGQSLGANPESRTVKIALALARFLSGLGCVGATLLLLNLFFDLSRRSQMLWAIVGILLAAGLSLSAGMGAKLLSLQTGVTFSVIGMLWGGLPRIWDAFRGKGEIPQRPTEIFGQAVKTLLTTTGLTMLGGAIIISLLNSWKYMSKTDEFLGEKATLTVPLLIVALAFAGEVFPHRVVETGAAAARERARKLFVSTLEAPFNVRLVLTLGILAVAGMIFILRSGNESGMEISSFEWNMRAQLERIFLTRPRTKEFLIGMPALIFAVWFIRQRRWPFAFLSIMAVTVGQMDVINTFCHIHTPIFYSLLRTIHALWMGALIGLVALIVWNAVESRVTRFLKRLELEAEAENSTTISTNGTASHTKNPTSII